MTLVTQIKLNSKRKTWNCSSVEYVTVIKEKVEFEARLYELAKIIYDELCQPSNSLKHDLGIIQPRIDTNE